MNDDLGLIAGCLLIFLVCAWAVGHLAARVGGNIRAEIATDRTLSEVDKESAPALFWLQTIASVLLIGALALIGIGALVAIIVRLASKS